MSQIESTIDQTMKLHDGRILGYAEYGNPNGKPLLYFHGHPGARYEAALLGEAAKKHNVRLIGVDRPGLGLSTYKPGRHFLDWPDDVLELAAHLQLERFAVVGFSGGGPYALACALKMPERLTACGVVSGVGRSGRFISFLASWMPWLILPTTKHYFADTVVAKKNMAKFTAKWIEPDRKVFAILAMGDIIVASLVEAFRQGTKGAAYDGTLIGARNWGFQLEDITFQNIHLWHGEIDDQVKVAQAKESAKRLTHCEAVFYPNEGHISTIANHEEGIVVALMNQDTK